MQAIMETVFDVLYLTTVVFLGVRMLRTGGTNRQHRLFGLMAVTLGAGDAFHLVPRAIALCTTGLENYTAALGAGKFITSITMTVFYVLLYYVWRLRYEVKGKRGLTALVYAPLYLLRTSDWRGTIALALIFPAMLWAHRSNFARWREGKEQTFRQFLFGRHEAQREEAGK